MELTEHQSYIQSQLAEISDQLEQLISDSEEQFLVIGGGLEHFLESAGRVATTSAAATKILAGDHISVPVEELQTMLARIEDYMGRSEADTSDAKARLKNILAMIDDIRKPIDSLSSLLKILIALGIRTKIESAMVRQDWDDFRSIATQVDELSQVIKVKSADISKKEQTVSRLIRRTLSEVTVFEQDREYRAQAILGEAQPRLDTMSVTHQHCSATTAFVAEASLAVSRDIDGIVESVQSHDIARQQIEQVRDVLNELAVTLSVARIEMNEDDTAAGPGMEGRTACAMQAARLRQAGQTLISASNHITSSLKAIADNVNGITNQTTEIAGTTKEVGNTSLADLETGLKGISRSLSETAASSQNLVRVMTVLADSMKEMSSFVKDIENIVSDVELIALNAQIKAANLGDKGSALGVLAESIKQLSVEVAAEIAIVPAVLNQIVGAAQELHDTFTSETDEEGSATGDAALSSILASLLKRVRKANDELVAVLSTLDESALSLVGQINVMIGELTIAEDTAEIIGIAALRLDGLAGQARPTQNITFAATVVQGGAAEMGENVEMF